MAITDPLREFFRAVVPLGLHDALGLGPDPVPSQVLPDNLARHSAVSLFEGMTTAAVLRRKAADIIFPFLFRPGVVPVLKAEADAMSDALALTTIGMLKGNRSFEMNIQAIARIESPAGREARQILAHRGLLEDLVLEWHPGEFRQKVDGLFQEALMAGTRGALAGGEAREAANDLMQEIAWGPLWTASRIHDAAFDEPPSDGEERTGHRRAFARAIHGLLLASMFSDGFFLNFARANLRPDRRSRGLLDRLTERTLIASRVEAAGETAFAAQHGISIEFAVPEGLLYGGGFDFALVDQVLPPLLRRAIEHRANMKGEAARIRIGWDEASHRLYIEASGRAFAERSQVRRELRNVMAAVQASHEWVNGRAPKVGGTFVVYAMPDRVARRLEDIAHHEPATDVRTVEQLTALALAAVQGEAGAEAHLRSLGEGSEGGAARIVRDFRLLAGLSQVRDLGKFFRWATGFLIQELKAIADTLSQGDEEGALRGAAALEKGTAPVIVALFRERFGNGEYGKMPVLEWISHHLSNVILDLRGFQSALKRGDREGALRHLSETEHLFGANTPYLQARAMDALLTAWTDAARGRIRLTPSIPPDVAFRSGIYFGDVDKALARLVQDAIERADSAKDDRFIAVRWSDVKGAIVIADNGRSGGEADEATRAALARMGWKVIVDYGLVEGTEVVLYPKDGDVDYLPRDLANADARLRALDAELERRMSAAFDALEGQGAAVDRAGSDAILGPLLEFAEEVDGEIISLRERTYQIAKREDWRPGVQEYLRELFHDAIGRLHSIRFSLASHLTGASVKRFDPVFLLHDRSLRGIAYYARRAHMAAAAKNGVQIALNQGLPEEIASFRLTGRDGKLLYDVLNNLVSNAVKYFNPDLPAGARRVEIRASADGGDLLFEVEDNGRGMTAEELARYGQSGWRAEAVKREEIAGSGVGASSAKNKAAMLGGRLVVHSDGPGKGLLASVRIPLRNLTPPPPASAGGQPSGDGHQDGPVRAYPVAWPGVGRASASADDSIAAALLGAAAEDDRRGIPRAVQGGLLMWNFAPAASGVAMPVW